VAEKLDALLSPTFKPSPPRANTIESNKENQSPTHRRGKLTPIKKLKIIPFTTMPSESVIAEILSPRTSAPKEEISAPDFPVTPRLGRKTVALSPLSRVLNVILLEQ
jgi:hypothetical protein